MQQQQGLSPFRAKMRAFSRGGPFVDFMLLLIFLSLVYVFVTRRGYMKQVDNTLTEKFDKDPRVSKFAQNGQSPASTKLDNGGETADKNSGKFFDPRLAQIPDARDKPCRDKQYQLNEGVSIIADFFDYQFYDLRTSVGSCIKHAPPGLIKEIIVVDDGSTLDYIKEEVKLFVSKLGYGKMLRNEQRIGTGRARTKGAEKASSKVLVFLDVSVICNMGWLEPLVDSVLHYPKVIAVPHFDSVNDPVSYKYDATSSSLTATFTWSLATRMVETPAAQDVTQPLKTPVIRGNAFAADKSYFFEIGALDMGFTDIGGEHLEFSFRTWMCGGEIKIIPCSRVGIMHLHETVKIVSHQNIGLIAEMWLGDKRDMVLRMTGAKAVDKKAMEGPMNRKSSLKVQCTTFDWYMQNVANGMYLPAANAKEFGRMKCKTGVCARVGKDQRIDVSDCNPRGYNSHRKDMLFEYSTDYQITVNGQCLTTQTSAYITVEDCKKGDTKQMYEYTPDKTFKNHWSNFCMMHVTDPDKTFDKRQIAMAQDCKQDKDGQFSTWEFINT